LADPPKWGGALSLLPLWEKVAHYIARFDVVGRDAIGRKHLALDALEREVFADIVLGAAPNHFVPGDTPLIAHLARNIVLTRTAFGEMKAAGYVSDGKVSPWLAVLQHAAREMRATARMLSLSAAS
jgi:hypothetical protein